MLQDPSQLSRSKMQDILAKNHIHFHSTDSLVTLAKHYRSLITSRRTNKGTLTLPRSTTPRRSNSSLDCADHTSDVAPELGRSAQSIIDSLPPSTSQPANGCTPPPNTSNSANPQHELKGAHPSPESQITKEDTYNPQIPDPATPVPDLLESLA